jgi:hypothetical protein
MPLSTAKTDNAAVKRDKNGRLSYLVYTINPGGVVPSVFTRMREATGLSEIFVDRTGAKIIEKQVADGKIELWFRLEVKEFNLPVGDYLVLHYVGAPYNAWTEKRASVPYDPDMADVVSEETWEGLPVTAG